MRLSQIRARSLREGDQIVVTVSRTLGMQGRKPASGSPLMRIEFSDGTVVPVRENERVTVLR